MITGQHVYIDFGTEGQEIGVVVCWLQAQNACAVVQVGNSFRSVGIGRLQAVVL